MKHFNENASVIFTDQDGRQIDTFVVFGTDPVTGLTRINHENLRVPASQLRLHAKTMGDHHMPLEDAFSFELLRLLKEKYRVADMRKRSPQLKPTGASKGYTHLRRLPDTLTI
ncbi:hypothetical protein [Mucilaginibacter lappiensis]|uniref:hypothetical protein n=1 Tax=Mucilaginibacter lappiensis TaxID=354630 RepID=UPI003D1D8299